MSDFDKEAEREKLREKYERDKEDREATQRMSDLLLKGATMTNTHCGVCGDPFFQQDGVTFCPSCHGSPDGVEGPPLEGNPQANAEAGNASDTDQQGDVEASAENATTSSANTETQSDTVTDDRTHRERTQVEEATPARAEPASSAPESDHEPQSTGPNWDSVRTPPSQAPGGSETAPSAGGREPNRSESNRAFDAPSTAPPQDDGLEDAHTALTQALEHFAHEAATTNDPRYAKECLEAAREAAEALAALR